MNGFLIIGESISNRKTYDKLLQYCKDYRRVRALDDLKRVFEVNKYDVCVLFENKKSDDAKKLFRYIIDKDKQQKILVIQEKVNNCFFDYNCEYCNLDHNVVTINDQYCMENIITILENFQFNSCQNLIKNNISTYLATNPFFKGLNKEVISNIAQISALKHYKKGEIVLYEGDKSDYFYFLANGNLQSYITKPDGTQIVLRDISSPSFVLESDIIEDTPFRSSIKSISSSLVVIIQKNEFQILMEQNVALSNIVLSSMKEDILSLKEMIYKNMVLNTSQRVAAEILENPKLLQYKNKFDISNDLNMAPGTLSRVLKSFKEEKILDRKSYLIDKEKLIGKLLE